MHGCILLLGSVGLCAAFPQYAKTRSVEGSVQRLEGDIWDLGDLEQERAVGDAKKFFDNYQPSQDFVNPGAHKPVENVANNEASDPDTGGLVYTGKPLNALIPCPVISSIYNRFSSSDPSDKGERSFQCARPRCFGLC